MDINIDDMELPVEIMTKALKLRNSVRGIYITLFIIGRPACSVEVAKEVRHARAYVNMSLQELVDLGYVRVEQIGRTKYFEVVQ